MRYSNLNKKKKTDLYFLFDKSYNISCKFENENLI